MRKNYLRFLKTVALADNLTLTAAEIAYLATERRPERRRSGLAHRAGRRRASYASGVCRPGRGPRRAAGLRAA